MTKNANNLRKKVKSAYRCNHSTETAILKFHNDLLMPADIGEFLDPVNIHTLLNQLSVTPHFYADDSQLFVHYNPSNPDAVQYSKLTNAAKR